MVLIEYTKSRAFHGKPVIGCISLLKPKPRGGYWVTSSRDITIHQIPRSVVSNQMAGVSFQRVSVRRRAINETDPNRRTIRIVIIMYLTFVLCWIPYYLLTILTDFEALPSTVEDQKFFCHLVARCLALTSVIWNPVLYGWANQNFKRAFMEILFCNGR